MQMMIQRRPRPQRRRQLTALVLAGAVLYLVATTAASPTARSAMEALGKQGDLALGLLRSQLADPRREEVLPASVSLAIGQSPLLLSSQEAVLRLRRTEEQDDSDRQDAPAAPGGVQQPEQTDPIPEQPAQPETPLVFADNGVAARTLIPSSPEGYLVAGSVYISNRTDYALDASLFDGSFAAALPAEEGPQVLIVHTHGSEAYTMPAGQEYVPSGDCRTTDNAYNVVRVGDELAKTLEEAGLTVLHDPTLHDYPEYSGAYGRSLDAVNAYLEQYPTISFVLDVHRDAIEDSQGNQYKVVSTIEGEGTSAQMTLVVGSDGSGLTHPDWIENLRLAVAIQQEALAEYPTLMRPLLLRNSRYNQHATTGSLLVEVGAAGNAPEEAALAGRLFAQRMTAVLDARSK